MIPVHNGAATVRSAIASALVQEGPTVEVVVVDDGSTDATAPAVASVDDRRVNLVRQSHAGVSSARNVGAAAAVGRWLVFLDADDELLPAALTALLPTPGDNHALVVGRVEFVSWGAPSHVGPRARISALVYPMLAGCFGVDAVLFRGVGGYNERLGFAENTDLGIRLLPACRACGRAVRTVDHVVVRTRSVTLPDRHTAYAERILAASDVFLGEHRAVLEAEGLTAMYASSAGVAAARLRRWRKARYYFALAVRSRGRRASDAARWAVSWVPLVRRRVWPHAGERDRARSRNHS